ncbi:MAG: HMA2 domain-containing protein [Pseudomonadota bacterium]
MTPTASIVHRLENRVRIRLVDQPPHPLDYFRQLEKKLKTHFGYQVIQINQRTGSLIFQDNHIDVDDIIRFAAKERLFKLTTPDKMAASRLAGVTRQHLARLNAGVLNLTGNQLDISGSVFLVLILHAFREIVRGNLTLPSWFTALWFASTLYNRDFQRYNQDFYGPGGSDSHGHDGGSQGSGYDGGGHE